MRKGHFGFLYIALKLILITILLSYVVAPPVVLVNIPSDLSLIEGSEQHIAYDECSVKIRVSSNSFHSIIPETSWHDTYMAVDPLIPAAENEHNALYKKTILKPPIIS